MFADGLELLRGMMNVGNWEGAIVVAVKDNVDNLVVLDNADKVGDRTGTDDGG